MKKWWEKGKNKAKRRRTPPPTKNFPLVGAKLIFLGGGNNMIHFHNIYAWKYMCTSQRIQIFANFRCVTNDNILLNLNHTPRHKIKNSNSDSLFLIYLIFLKY